MIEITGFTKNGGPLTKRISLGADGTLCSNASECVMARGAAQRVRLSDLHSFGRLLDRMAPEKAIGLGTLRHNLPEQVEITTKLRLETLNGSSATHLIARTSEHIVYRPGQPALVLIDIDTKGMPAAVRERIDARGGFWPALVSVLPELEAAGRVARKSTSAGLSRTDTGERLPGSNGEHVFILVTDGTDAERFLRTMHDRCWLHGFGWLMVGAGGQLLDRSIVDRMVFAPERLVFEGAPVLDAPLVQDEASRQPVVTVGAALDTSAACSPLRIVEQAKLRELHAKDAHRLAPDRAKAHEKFVAAQVERIVTRTGMTPQDARRTVERQCDGVLLPPVVLPFDAEDMRGCTVADVLADPDRFVGATLADPLEGIEYGRCCAKVMQRPDGTLWIHSFAHGRTTYELKHDANAIAAIVAKAADAEAVDMLARLIAVGDIADHAVEQLVGALSQRCKVGKRTIARAIAHQRKDQAHQQHQEDQERRAAARTDPRPQIAAPAPDAPWLPQMGVLNEVLGASSAAEPPMRDIDGAFATVRVRRVPNMHALTASGANEAEAEDSRLPAPEQPLLTRLNEAQLAEAIERHIDYTDPSGRSVHLASPFVRHYLNRTDDALPLVAAVATLPIILVDGTLLHGRGLVRERGIVFRIPPELLAYIPTIDDCHDDAVVDALTFLTDTWLVDVATNYAGKCCLIAAALTLIERSVLPDRPVFFVTAGRRGGGKTTTLIMLLMAITGVRPAAAAWSPNEEERRKALLAYLMEALPAIIWDNIPRGAQISCPHIERSCTTAFYSDRRLGVSELVAVAASAINFFTGNNIAPRGDLASRALTIRLEVDRSDPENRPFTHPDPIAWTEANRGKILNALFTLLLANPRLRRPEAQHPARTRFKAWYQLTGSAVEHAVTMAGGSLDFQSVFLAQEAEEEESSSLADALRALADKWPNTANFNASDVATMVNDRSEFTTTSAVQQNQILREVLFPNAPPAHVATARAVGKRLHRHLGEPVTRDGKTLVLKEWRPSDRGNNGALAYFVQVAG